METAKSSSSFGKSQISVSCPCWRPRKRVLCTCCGFIMEGRIKIKCKEHPNMMFINDYDQCLRCKVHYFMLKEF